jgi:unsaturated rhamnogalacturonyl hydrolase
MGWKFRIWGFGEAIALRGLYQATSITGDSIFRDHVDGLLEVYVNRGVGISAEEHIAPGTELLLLYQRTGDERYVRAAQKLAALHASFSIGPSGARIHRADLPGWRRQIWVDCMDAEPPFLALLGRVTGNCKFFDQAASEILGYARLLQDEETGLFFHGFEEACGRNGQIWARGNGWALMGLVEVLKLLPKKHSHYDELSERLVRTFRALARYQHSSGLWHTVVANQDTYLESTLAVMTAYSLREAFKAELIDESEFREVEQQARAASMRLITEDGALNLVTDATPVAELKMYATRPFGIYPWGQGPLLLMLAQS